MGAGHSVAVAVAAGLGEALLELGEQGLVLLVQQLGLLAQPFVLLEDVAVLHVQLGVEPVHFFPPATKKSNRVRKSAAMAIASLYYICGGPLSDLRLQCFFFFLVLLSPDSY